MKRIISIIKRYRSFLRVIKETEYVCKNRSFRIKVKISSGSLWTKPIKGVIFHTKEVVGPSPSTSRGATWGCKLCARASMQSLISCFHISAETSESLFRHILCFHYGCKITKKTLSLHPFLTHLYSVIYLPLST